MDRDIERIPAIVVNREVFPFVTIELPLNQAGEPPDPVIDVYNKIAGLQIRVDRLGCLCNLFLPNTRLRSFPAKDFGVSDEMQPA